MIKKYSELNHSSAAKPDLENDPVLLPYIQEAKNLGYQVKFINRKPVKWRGKHYPSTKIIEIFAKDRSIESIRDTLLHELGHMVDYERRGIIADPMGDSIKNYLGEHEPMADHHIYFRYPNWIAEANKIRQEFPRQDSVSTTQKEIWADAYKLYRLEPEKLKSIAPLIFGEIEKWVKK